MSKSILITGITGFLGSHLGRYFSEKKYQVIGLRRSSSNLWRCEDYINNVSWVNADKIDWQNDVIQLKPEIIIHAAWEGVTAGARDDFKNQLNNLNLLIELLEISKKIKVHSFISLGTQAEYGKLESVAYEAQTLKPNSAYGIVKVMASRLVEFYCESNNINWYWLRVFSVFGETESENWLIPSLIKKIVNNQSTIELSTCEQKYAYIYINDFVKLVHPLIDETPISGVYNISGINSIELKRIVLTVHEYLKSNNTVLAFGAIPQRDNQSTIVEGSMDKYTQNIKKIEYCNLNSALFKTIDYYQQKFENNKQS